MPYGLADILKMAEGAGNDPGKYAVLQGLMQGPGGGAIDSALRQSMGADKAKSWLDSMHNQYGSTGGFDAGTGEFQYHDVGNPLEESSKEWQYKKGKLAGWDPSQFDPNQLQADMKSWEAGGAIPGITAAPGGNSPGTLQPKSAIGAAPIGAGGRAANLPPGVTNPLARGGGGGFTPENLQMIQQLLGSLGRNSPATAGSRATTGKGGGPGSPSLPGKGGGGTPPGGGAGASPYPNINRLAGTNPANYTGLPMRGFDPSLLLRDVRQRFGAKGGAGQVNQMPTQAPGQLQNNLKQWDQIFSRG